MDPIELESIAVDLCTRHRLDPAAPVSTWELARRMLGRDCITRPPTLLGRFPAATYRVGGQTRIALRRTVPDDELLFFVGHELGHVVLERRVDGEYVEAACDYLGACLIAPRPCALALHRRHGLDIAAMASDACATQTWAALRLGEACGLPVVTVGPVAVRARGPRAWEWPSSLRLRRDPPPGHQRIRVTDRPRRHVLVWTDAA